MKKLLGILLVVVSCYGGQAQIADKTYLLNDRTLGVGTPSVKIARDFWKRVGDGKNEQWYNVDLGFVAVYTDCGAKARFFYDKKGNWVYSIRQFGEKQLPEDVRR